ncbi:MAG: phosphonopyruvate decarboxylase [Paracoccaceae bacterium]
MINPHEFYNELLNQDIGFFTGVPDSLLKGFCSVLLERTTSQKHVIAPNEGAAIGIAIGHYAATGNVPLVYMQNSGIGNAVNPLISLADPLVMATPIIMVIGWRGEIAENGQQIKDEPQHVKQGQITADLLKGLGIPFEIICSNSDFVGVISKLKKITLDHSCPTAIIVRRGTFSSSDSSSGNQFKTIVSRENALQKVIESIESGAAIISTTGMLSRELYELRALKGQLQTDLLTVGAMGHAISIATGVACAKPNRQVFCLDGDGSILMHLGALSISATMDNLTHVVFNNKSHDSVGGQPTCAPDLSLSDVANSLGYSNVFTVSSEKEVEHILQCRKDLKGSKFIEIICAQGNRANLGRPQISPRKNLNSFSSFLKSE